MSRLVTANTEVPSCDRSLDTSQADHADTPLISANAVALSRGGIAILRDISLSLSAGDVTLLRGANGIGKTSLLRAMAGLLRLDEGEINAAPDQCAFFTGAGGVKAGLSVDENLHFWAALYGTDGNAIADAKTAFGLEPLADRRAGALSTGYARRLGLARLTLTGRSIWLIDEPTASLDDAGVALFLSALAHHRERGGAALIATHDPIDIEDARILTLGALS